MHRHGQLVRVIALLATTTTAAAGQAATRTSPLTAAEYTIRVAPEPDSLPPSLRRAVAPRPSLSGTFEVREEIIGKSGLVLGSNWGYLFATKDVGLLALAAELDGERLGKTHVYAVRRLTTNAAGDVSLHAGFTYDGYQTADSGFVAEAVIPDSSSRRAWLSGAPTRLSPSRSDGLFAVTSRTFYEENGKRVAGAEPTEWTGDMAVAFGGGTMYVDLVLRNPRGGKVGFFAAGALAGDNFDLRDASGSRLVGAIRDGVLTAEWTDKRPGKAAFVGKLRAQRR
jgi:hypothetical protein